MQTVASKTDHLTHTSARDTAAKVPFFQPKLTINAPGDPYEQEADAMADMVMRMSINDKPFFSPNPLSISRLQRKCAHCEEEEKMQRKEEHEDEDEMLQKKSLPGVLIQRKCAHCEEEEKKMQRKENSSQPAEASSMVSSYIQSLPSKGSPLPDESKSFFESRFGYDFSDVKIHNDADAAKSSKSVNALAYTHGNNIVFSAGQYQPNTNSGNQLLAHELTHVVQQGSLKGDGRLQRAEVDDRSCAGLKDIEPDIDTIVNKEIDDIRKVMDKPTFAPLLALRVAKALGGRSPRSPIEDVIEQLPPSKQHTPDKSLANTKYSGAETAESNYLTQIIAGVPVVGSSAKIHGICVGADKLGHFFDQGFDYFDPTSRPAIFTSGTSPADIENLGKQMEAGVFGLSSTGVFSNADIAANKAGLQFYNDLSKAPDSLRFHIKNYITKHWNEQSNPSFYTPALGFVVWSNLLNGAWGGEFKSASKSSAPVSTKFNLIATSSGGISGSFNLELKDVAPVDRTVTITSGSFTENKTAIVITTPTGPSTIASPVNGINIEFSWQRKADSGKGKLLSVNEQTLTGTLGIGPSDTGSGSFTLKKQ